MSDRVGKDSQKVRIHYRKTENGVEIVRCFGSDSHVEIPGEIQGMPVVRAAAYAFSARTMRTNLTAMSADIPAPTAANATRLSFTNSSAI